MKKSGFIKFAPPAIFVIVLLFLWDLVSSLHIVNEYILPSPATVFKTFMTLTASGELLSDIAVSMLRVARGFSIAFCLAFVLGMISSVVPVSKWFFEYLVHFFKNVPPISMIPLLILWAGIGEATKTIIIILASFFPMYMSIVKGFTGCEKKLLEVGTVFEYSKMRLFLNIVLPSAIADILVGMRIGLGYAWRAIIGAEMVAASTGLGHMILFSQQMARTDKVIAGIFVIGFTGYLCDKCFALLVANFIKGAESNERN